MVASSQQGRAAGGSRCAVTSRREPQQGTGDDRNQRTERNQTRKPCTRVLRALHDQYRRVVIAAPRPREFDEPHAARRQRRLSVEKPRNVARPGVLVNSVAA